MPWMARHYDYCLTKIIVQMPLRKFLWSGSFFIGRKFLDATIACNGEGFWERLITTF